MKRMSPALLALIPLAALAEPRNPLDALRLEDLSATRERPLFAPTRRPAPLAPDAPAAPEPAQVDEKPVALGPPPLELIGAVVGARDAIALLRNTATHEVLRLRPGEEAQGWRVDSVGLRTVALAHEGRQLTLALVGPPGDAAGPLVAGEPAPAPPGPPGVNP